MCLSYIHCVINEGNGTSTVPRRSICYEEVTDQARHANEVAYREISGTPGLEIELILRLLEISELTVSDTMLSQGPVLACCPCDET